MITEVAVGARGVLVAGTFAIVGPHHVVLGRPEMYLAGLVALAQVLVAEPCFAGKGVAVKGLKVVRVAELGFGREAVVEIGFAET